MIHLSTIQNLRFRYLIGLSAIALLVTSSYITMQHVVSKQRDYSGLINLASHQAGLTNRIAYFASLMAVTEDEAEFSMARAQVGRTIYKIKSAHEALRKGSPEDNIPKVVNDSLLTIYEDPMVGLERALTRFLERAQQVYDSDMENLNTGSAAYLFLTTYGPHVLEPLLDAAVDEYGKIGREAILKIERLELIIWLAAIATLLMEVGFIFRPLERQVRNTLDSLKSSVSELTDTRKRLVAAQKLASVGDWELDIRTGEITWSDQIYEIYGVSVEEFSVTRQSSLKLVHPQDRAMVEKDLSSLAREEASLNMEYRITRPDGKECLVYQHAASIKGNDGRVKKIVGSIQDITERKELSTRLEKLSQHIPGFIFQFHLDPEGRSWLPYASTGIIDTCGIRPEKLKNDSQALFQLFHEEDIGRVKDKIRESSKNLKTWQDQYRIHHPEKGIVWLEGQATPELLMDGGTLWYGYIWDITERKHSEEQIRKLALYDSLTGLANRRLINDRLAHAIAVSRRKQNFGAVLMLDLDNFKSLNDTKGHNVGDALLVEVAKRLRNCVRETDTVGRLGGDEFVIVLEWLGEEEKPGRKKAMKIAEKIRLALNRVYILGKQGHAHHSSASIGVSLFQNTDINEGEVLKRADVAMYEAKDLGRNRCCFYNEVRQTLVNNRSALAHDMQIGLENEEFFLYLQPQFWGSGRICGAEALLRWLPPGKEPIPPGSFIPVAENTGLILPLGEWAIEKACGYLTDLKNQDLPEDFAIAVNISARQFVDEDFVGKIVSIFKRTGVDPRRLKFELTETCLIQDMNRGRLILNELRGLGLRVELDDFGTGYSSLNSINNLPLNALKLDRSLIQGIENEGSSTAIVRAALAMAKAMSLMAIAEGVETRGQRDFLVKEGCEMLQGFYFARPMPYDDFKNYLQTILDFPENREQLVFPAEGLSGRGLRTV
ncbi:sensor domain-containing protein [Desulfospira joergensenii]|uniref:sensor domain-containing protein n=1 Tax=Desulfospira joergensenii TaxID=53329 RepID=UPI0003B6C5BB|nr:GGDEF and EAL domain-containing protein [Desulfospira joergensenii]